MGYCRGVEKPVNHLVGKEAKHTVLLKKIRIAFSVEMNFVCLFGTSYAI